MILEKIEGKYFKLTIPDDENENRNDIVVKIKFLIGVTP